MSQKAVYASKRIEKSPKGDKLDLNIQLFAKNSKEYETVILPKKEYSKVMHELSTNLTDEQRTKKVFSKATGDYIYTVEKIKIDEDL